MNYAMKVKPGDDVRLDDIDPGFTAGLTEEEAAEELADLSEKIGELQELLYAARQNSVLVILQGMDTSGKDGTIKRVMSEVDPPGCRVESFKVPTEEELAHDFLWRVHRVVPPLGMMTIFNRSHYEDVVIVRVHDLVPKHVWKQRYDAINNFERLLADSGTIILKFYLHISRAEQKQRLEARERDVEKAWKLSVGDWKERELWDDYIRAYEDAISRCTTEPAPWHIIPANKKWFRNLAVADAIVHTLRPYRDEWEESLSKLAETKLAELAEMRGSERNGE
ncbi:MAG TPA: PPK2 family polyphosphate kinase [Blastocatellia bacterium]|nr:PPK2 family polyphosphate kinase [Blastocatellia bacterium]